MQGSVCRGGNIQRRARRNGDDRAVGNPASPTNASVALLMTVLPV